MGARAAWLLAVALIGLPVPAAAQVPPRAPLEARIRAAEDARADTPEALAPILEGLRGASDAQRLAVRALGRLQRESLLPHIVPLLASPAVPVRVEAATAMAQSVVDGRAAMAFAPLVERARRERDTAVLGAIARSLGRLRYGSGDEVRAAEAALLRIAATRRGSPPAVAGVAHAFDALARRVRRLSPSASATLGSETRAWLARCVTTADASADPFARRLALSALVTLEAVDEPTATRALADGDDQIRRLAVLGAAAAGPVPWVAPLLDRAATDAAPLVRHAALRVRSQAAPATACAAARAGLDGPSPHVSLLAIDVAGQQCGGEPGIVERLASLRGPIWHTRAHVLVALARLDPGRGREWLRALLRLSGPGPGWPMGRYVAGAAGILRDVTTLEALAQDPHPNVVEAALAELDRFAQPQADAAAIAALARDDHQLVRTAALTLAGTAQPAAATPALVAALTRLTALRRETSRDARLALLDRLEELGRGQPGAVEVLRARLADFDPAVAARAAAILRGWTGGPITPSPQPLPAAPVPTAPAIDRLRASEVVMTMGDGAVVRIRLFPDEAPTNVARFARLIDSRYFDGLTFHRVEPGFVIQGGSPNGNEYMSDGPFTRDEFANRSHRRGTIGISTRGRDTGDGQIFVNLVDNPRLDHAYTIIGEVVAGMEVVDHVLEADLIATMRMVVRGKG